MQRSRKYFKHVDDDYLKSIPWYNYSISRHWSKNIYVFMELLLVAFPTFGWQPISMLPVLFVISTKL